MSTERDELADRLADSIFRYTGVTTSSSKSMADELLAAGYRKPRQVTTVEELDALPVRSVVLRNGRAFTRYKLQPDVFGEYQEWKCADGGFVRSSKDGSSILPATVLHVGGAE